MKTKSRKSGEKKSRSVLKTVLVLFLAFGIYGVITAYSAYKSDLERNYDSIDRSVDITIDTIVQSLNMIRGTNIALSGNSSIENWRKDSDYFKSDAKEVRLHIEALTDEMKNTLIYNNGWNLDLIDYVAVYEDNNLIAYSSTKPFTIQTIFDKSAGVLKRIKNNQDYSFIISPTEEDPTIYTTLRIQGDFSTLNSIYVISATSASYLEGIIETTTGYEGALMYLIDSEGTIYASNEEGVLGSKIGEDILNLPYKASRIHMAIDKTPYAVSKKAVNSQFSFVYMLPKDVIIKHTILSMRPILLLSIILTIIMAALVTMIETQYREKILMEETEIQFLQQQMNPHFLFNILLTIQIKAKMNGDEAVSKMITSLSNLLRAGIYGDKRKIISIREELKYVEYYLSLQKERYDERLTYNITVEDEELLDCEVPRLSIEPLVENAVVHGIEVSDKDGIVDIVVTKNKNDVLIHVKDNGVGFDPKSLNLEKMKESKDGSLPREKVGVKNTAERLKIIYGGNYGLKIDSAPGDGTDVTVKIPKKKWVVTND